MVDYLSVSGVASHLEQRLGVSIPPRTISDLIYQRVLPAGRCPILGGRRLIPGDLLPLIEDTLRERGLIDKLKKEDDM